VPYKAPVGKIFRGRICSKKKTFFVEENFKQEEDVLDPMD
jgi:hypothetical protein